MKLDKTNSVSMDFETASMADLRKVGAAVYAEHPSTRILCLCFSCPWDKGDPGRIRRVRFQHGYPPSLVLEGTGLDGEMLRDWIQSGEPVRAWNAVFEYLIWNLKLAAGSDTPRIKPGQLHDTMAQAAYWGLPLSLDKAGEALPQLGVKKDMAGRKLMMQMARPRKAGALPSGSDSTWWHVDEPQRMDPLMDYCEQDVRTEMAIGDYLPALPDAERKVWLMDLKANYSRGIAVDLSLAGDIVRLGKETEAILDRNMALVSEGQVRDTRDLKGLKAHLALRGVTPSEDVSLSKDQLPVLREVAKAMGDKMAERVVAIREEAAKTSVAKARAMESWACRDGRIRGLTQYYGANRTGRWAGRGPQVHNYPRGTIRMDMDVLCDAILNAPDPETLDALIGPPMEVLSSALRGCLTSAHGKWLASIDKAQIEARVLPWLAGATDKIQAFRDYDIGKGPDIYKVSAAGIYQKHPDQIDKDERQIGKVGELALGFGGGAGAFQAMAKNYGVVVDDVRADQIKLAWRQANPEIVSFWYTLDRMARDTVSRGVKQGFASGTGAILEMAYWEKHDVLLIKLPSGRYLVYREPQIGTNRFGKPCVTYMGLDQYTNQWTRIETYGGKLAENITQAVARDLIAEAMLRLDAAGFAVLGSIHDEVLLELDDQDDFEPARAIVKQVPEWAKGLPVDADGFVGKRFRKG